MKYIKLFDNLEYKKRINIRNLLLAEAYHIQNDMDDYSLKLYNDIKNNPVGIYIFTDLPKELNIIKLVISITKNLDSNARLNLDKCKSTKDGFIIHIDLKPNFKLDTLNHELDHALRFTFKDKIDILNKLNYLKSFNLFTRTVQNEIEQFIDCMYLASEEEFEAKVKQFHGEVKEEMINLNIDKLSYNYFNLIYNTSRVKNDVEMLKKFKIKDCFYKISDNNINKFFCIYEENKKELNRINSTRFTMFRKLKLIYKALKSALSDNFNFNNDDDKKYKPNKSPYYYEKWINEQGLKLEKKLKRLYNLYI